MTKPWAKTLVILGTIAALTMAAPYSVGIDGQDDGGDAGNNPTRGRDIVMPLK